MGSLAITRKRLLEMSLKRLRELAAELEGVIHELESSPVRREIDVATEYVETPGLIHEVLRTKGHKASSQWQQLQTVYCSLEHCTLCPHGPFWYRYSRNRRLNRVSVTFAGLPAIDEATLNWMRSTVQVGVPHSVLLQPKEKA